ncbi:MAG TPA: sigma-54 dependent transcriptional regulator [Vicinamibacteria bacterium]|nr:sigma-54 dependent transcriptional regulator [Vicinamibacteria bacterium]
MNRVLIVDDEAGSRQGLSELVKSWGFDTDVASDGIEGIEKAERFRPQVVIADLVMPRMDGLALLKNLSPELGHLAVVMLTAKGSISTAVEAMKNGAFDYLTKPVDTRQLRQVLDRAVERTKAFEEVERYRKELGESGSFGRIVGTSRPMRELYELMGQVAPSAASVLIVGESGTGKELVARTLHALSTRREEEFVAVNCAAIPETLLESEIFGHERGAFTGAEARRQGLFEAADGGTLFLDEVVEMSPATQAKLLRVLEDRRFRRLGGAEEIQADVRVLAATNRGPERALEEGKLREDLYYRLNVFTLELPPLRDRQEDLPALAASFVREVSERDKKRIEGFDGEAMAALQAYPWPGNVRELRNVVERSVIVARGSVIGLSDLPPFIADPGARVRSPSGVELPVGTTVEQAERNLILRTLEATGHNKTRAADLLGISLKTLHNKLKKYRESP